jgi:hypothetical protein
MPNAFPVCVKCSSRALIKTVKIRGEDAPPCVSELGVAVCGVKAVTVCCLWFRVQAIGFWVQSLGFRV